MTESLTLLPIFAVLLIALARVHTWRGERIYGAIQRDLALTFMERFRYHRISVLALGAVIVINGVGGSPHPLASLMAVVAMYGIVAIPIHVRFTRDGLSVNRLFFRRWAEFDGLEVQPASIRLAGIPGLRPLTLHVSGANQQAALAAIGGRLRARPASRGRRPLVLLAMAGAIATFLAFGAASSTVFADGPDVDPTGLTVGAPEDLGGVGVGGGVLTADDFAAAQADEPFAYNLAAYVNQNRLAINFMWTLVAGFLVMFMQAGFAMVETGFCRAKSAMHVMMTNFMVYGIGMLAYWATGFALQFGGVGLTLPVNLGSGLLALDKEAAISIAGTDYGIFGYKGFFLGPDTLDVGIAVLFLFQMVFMDTAATILTGAVAERWRWLSFCIWGIAVGGFIYPIFGNWAWGGGWLFQLYSSGLERPYVDFAGSGVVHSVGGWAALGAAWVLGPRLGKYKADGTPVSLPGHNINMAAIGTFILAFGWFGFNPGSTLGASGGGNLRIGEIAVVTMLAGAAGSVSAMLYARWTLGKYDPGYMINGVLAGLVAITAPSGYVSPILAVLIGAMAGVIVCIAMGVFERVLKIDDPVGAVSVHGVCGVFGVLCVGLFADGTAPDYLVVGHPIKGLFFGDGRQFIAQLIGAVTVMVWSFGTSYILFSVLKALGIFRSKPEDELAGLDLPEMGTHAYPLQDFDGALTSGAYSTAGGA
jgi:Amt family ammonium transporter